MTTRAQVPLLIDCDTGIDDALALLYAAASTEAELVGVSCVAGNVELPHIVRNTLAVLELAGRPDVPVAAGAAHPLSRPLRTAADTHGPTGLGYAVVPAPGRGIVAEDAAEAIVAAARARPGELTLVTLGPLTNVALALQREPELPRLLRRTGHDGRLVPLARQHGADHGVERRRRPGGPGRGPGRLARGTGRPSGRPATGRLRPGRHRARQADARPPGVPGARAGGGTENAVVRFVSDALRFYFEFHSRYDGFYGAFIHDALALAAALDPGLARTEALAVEVELEGRWTTGETVTDWRRAWGREPNLDVAVEADIAAFFERFIERVGGLAAQRPGERPDDGDHAPAATPEDRG